MLQILVFNETSLNLLTIRIQLCYAATKENNSFEVRLINQGATTSSESKVIAQCKTATTILGNEVTCYTSVAQVSLYNIYILLKFCHELGDILKTGASSGFKNLLATAGKKPKFIHEHGTKLHGNRENVCMKNCNKLDSSHFYTV